MQIVEFFNSTLQPGVVSHGGAAIEKKNCVAHSAYKELKPDVRQPNNPEKLKNSLCRYQNAESSARKSEPEDERKNSYCIEDEESELHSVRRQNLGR